MNISAIACCLPKKFETVDTAAHRLNIPKEQAKVLERIFGLKKLPIDLDMTVDSLMLNAANDCIEKANINRSHIKYVIHAHTAPVISPFGESLIARVQRQLGLDQAISFGTSMSKCSSVFMMFKIMQKLFSSLNADDHILIITGDVSFTEILQYIPGTTITTDGAAAILLTKSGERNQLINIEIDTYGQFAGGLWDGKDKQYLFENNYSVYLSSVIEKCVKKANLPIEDIKLIFPHNVNTLSWNKVIKDLKISPSKVFLKNIAETAHCFGTDPFLNYQTAIEQSLIEIDDYFILATVGLGATFSAMLFKR